jgi:class 3 adenylate cyclase
MESIIHGFEPGDRDYLTKPFNIEDAIQCVKMAQEMIFRTKIMGLDIPIGISTGECTVGNFGSEDRMDYTSRHKS